MTAQNWQEVGDKLAAMALKVKLHLEESGEAKATEAAEAVCASVEAAFDGLKAAVEDPAVQQDVRDAAVSLSDALRNSFVELRAQMKAAED